MSDLSPRSWQTQSYCGKIVQTILVLAVKTDFLQPDNAVVGRNNALHTNSASNIVRLEVRLLLVLRRIIMAPIGYRMANQVCTQIETVYQFNIFRLISQL